MNLIVVGASHRNAPVTLLEKLSLLAGPQPLTGVHVAEAVLLKTCNRVEIYAAVPAFHAGLSHLGEVLAQVTGVPAEELAKSLYVHHGIDAVRHVFRVAAGLESMVAGEAQILGQLRDAYQQASEVDTVGKTLHELMQQALRVGKRAHAETGIDKAPRSLVSAALDQATLALTPASPAPSASRSASAEASVRPAVASPVGAGGGRSVRWVIVGAGAMGALARVELTRRGVTEIIQVNRSEREGTRPLEDLPALMDEADVVISATASISPVITKAMVTKPITIIDLAMPRDVEVGVGDLAGVRLIDIEHLAAVLPDHSNELEEVERIVASEVDAFETWLRGGEVAPTVAALRSRADDVVGNELKRLAQRLPELSAQQRDEVAHALHRVVQRLLHQPTVRVRQLAAGPGGETYTQLVRDLFDLHPHAATVADIPEVAE
ncbi:glutamyl-tRNA reductase [Catelliglobosispora koreensis]|uniref:glutamyl-tRNA reductase n=1 Tax=Catelliglobosispora koreensis TaxID=129052 RepID=UPI00037ED455|nr:glutamyl-tRNA reductase [Catelliglobosispora koreensis]